MRSSIVFCLLSICIQMKLQVCTIICGEYKYTIIWSNGSVKGCLSCEKCHPGFGLSPVCGNRIKFPPENIACHPCPSGTFSDKADSAPCQNCQKCVAYEIVASNCTRYSDRNCSGTCTKGYYFAKRALHNCQQCSHCCNDGKDEIQLECVNQGLNARNQHCSPRPDKKCGPEPTPVTTPEPITSPAPATTQLPRTTLAHRTTNPSAYYVHPTNSSAWHDQPANHRNGGIIIMVLGVLVGVLLVALVVVAVLYKRNKVRAATAERHRHSSIETEMASTQDPGNPTSGNQVDLPQLPQVAPMPRLQALQNTGFSSDSNPATPQASRGTTPCHTDDELEELPDVVAVHKKRLVKRQNSKDASSDSTDESLLEKVQTIGRKGSFHSENAEGLHDNKESTILLQRLQLLRGAEGGHRRRSSTGSLHTFIRRKLSGAGEYQPLAGEDPDEVKESLRIVEQPTHQTQQEGCRVVFKCIAQGKKNLSYQWRKDRMKMQGKQSCTLVLDSVKVCDFGCYSCDVTYADGGSECLESSAAELDVSPPDGMRFRYLNEAFQLSFDTQQNVEKMLVKEIPGSGGWKQVAHKWKMNDLDFDSLERSHEGGKGVISYLKASCPELTVYEFCKTLKEPNIRRLDIVKELSVHLVSVPHKQTT